MILSILPLIYLESVVRAFTIGSFDIRFVYTVIFALPVGGVLYLCTLSDRTVFKVIYNLIISVISLYFCVQLVYYKVFQGFLSLSLVGVGGDAITNFTEELMNAIKAAIPGLAIILVLIVVYIILTVKSIISFKKTKLKFVFCSVIAIALLHILCLISLRAGGTGVYTVYDAYHSNSTGIDSSVQNLGIFVTTRLEVKNILLTRLGISVDDPTDLIFAPDPDSSDVTDSSDTEEYNVLDIDFEELKKLADGNATIENIFATIEWRGGTKKNEYTGIFKGYNLITICAESFSCHVIDEELTPTLYKLANEGFVFNNFYGSFESVTTDGEFSYCLGMFPDLSRGKYNSSFKMIDEAALPYALGNAFLSVGANTFAYHNNDGTYYGRNVSHPRMGYSVFKAADSGLDITKSWPASDLEMMQESVDDYISSGEQFHAYYMTFSGHHRYTTSNPMSAKNWDKVKDLDYSEAVKCYISANLELEYALTYLMERLEEEGIAEETVIVLTTDHYPYGLTNEEFSELAGKEIDPNFEKYKNSFICWNGGMEEAVSVDKLCSTIDIVPTLLNLFGMEFDSRFVIGRDVLSDHEGLAILANQSFITEDYMFNAVDNELTMLTDKEIPQEEIDQKKNFIVGTMGLSKSILNTDLYNYLIEYLENK